MAKLKELKGQNGIVIVHDEFLEISRKSFGGFVSQGGLSGERKFFYEDIRSIEYKTPTVMANGYIKVLTAGSLETNAKVGLLGSSMESMQDQNTVVLRAFTKSKGKEADAIYALIMDKLSKSKNTSTTAPSSKMDELKKLGELKQSGILTEEEFQAEKEKLLNS